MQLNELKSLLAEFSDRHFRISLPDSDAIPQSFHVTDDAVILTLANKHTECLAPELCGLPAISRLPALGEKTSCCGPGKTC